MGDKKKFFNSNEKKSNLTEESDKSVDTNVVEEIKESPKKVSPKKDEKMVMVQLGEDQYGNPDWKFVPESEVSKYK